MLSPREIIDIASHQPSERRRLGEAVIDAALACRSVFMDKTTHPGFLGVILGLQHDGSLLKTGKADGDVHLLNILDVEPLHGYALKPSDLSAIGVDLLVKALDLSSKENARRIYFLAKAALDRAILRPSN